MHRIILFLSIVFLCCSGISVADETSEKASAVLVKVNGSEIIQREVDMEVATAIPQTLFHRNVSPEKLEAFKKEAIERLIDKELQFQEGKKQGMKAEKGEIKDMVEEIKKRFPSNSDFKEALKKSNMTLKNLETQIEKDIIVGKIFQKEIEDKIKANDDEAKAHYESNMQRYKELEQIRMRHIMVKFNKEEKTGTSDKEQVTSDKEQVTSGKEQVASGKEQEASGKEQGTSGKEQGASGKEQEASQKEQVTSGHEHMMSFKSKVTRSKEEAKTRAEEILARLKEGGDFASIAYESSDDPYRVKGGDLGYVHKGRMQPELEEAAFNTKVGEIMGPVEAGEGFYIIRVEDHKQEKQFSFDEMKDRIKREIERKRREDKRREWLSALRSKAKIDLIEIKKQEVSSK